MKQYGKLFCGLLALIVTLSFAACEQAEQTTAPDVPKETLPLITRPAETMRAPAPETEPSHDCVWEDIESYRAYDTMGENGAVGYLAYHCTVEGCEQIKYGMFRPVLLRLDFEGESTLEEYLNNTEGVTPFYKKGEMHSAGEVRDGVVTVIDDVPFFIVCDRLFDEMKTPFRISFDAQIGVGNSRKEDDTIIGVGRVDPAVDGSYYFQLNETDGGLVYWRNYTIDDINTSMLSEYPLVAEMWYHFDLDIDIANKKVEIHIGTWADDARTVLEDYEYIGICNNISTSPKSRSSFAFRIANRNGLMAMDNLMIALPEE